jgi:hypothetical protein
MSDKYKIRDIDKAYFVTLIIRAIKKNISNCRSKGAELQIQLSRGASNYTEMV